MPSVSKKQHNFMAAVANSPTFAKKVGVAPSVGQEFMRADGRLKVSKSVKTRPDLQKINRPDTSHGKTKLFAEGGEMKESKAMMKKEVGFMKKAGAPKSMIKHEMKEAGMKYGGAAKKMAGGGLTAGHKSADGVARKGKTKGTQVAMKKGGYC